MQLLGELLLERSNLKVMVRYVADEDNLKLMMNLLRDSSRSIQFEAFHVFKVCYMQWALSSLYCASDKTHRVLTNGQDRTVATFTAATAVMHIQHKLYCLHIW